MKTILCINGILILLNYSAIAQVDPDTLKLSNQTLDSLYIQQVQRQEEPEKILHAEPLYIDLIRDLGARKGEKEWNLGLGLTDKLNYDSYEALIEYEWAPINRLGLEVEVPFTIYTPNSKDRSGELPSNRMESLKTAFQWSFLVATKINTTLAFGYINELDFEDLEQLSWSNFLKGNVYNPFFIVAKRWGNNFHTLMYTGPVFERTFRNKEWHTAYETNTSFHYMITGTRNFVGVEFNKEFQGDDFDMVIRPQMRLAITNQLMVGIVAGIPVSRENERLSSFIRLIYEPGHH